MSIYGGSSQHDGVYNEYLLTTIDTPWYVASTSLTSLHGTLSFSDTNTPYPWAPCHTLL